jgi:DNA-binding transcriptional LysR family regulator
VRVEPSADPDFPGQSFTITCGIVKSSSPEYFKSYKVPRNPQDLKDHACIGFRFSNGLYRWEFEKGRKALTVSPQGPASFDDPDLVIQAVLNGVGIGTAMEETLKGLIADGRLL